MLPVSQMPRLPVSTSTYRPSCQFTCSLRICPSFSETACIAPTATPAGRHVHFNVDLCKDSGQSHAPGASNLLSHLHTCQRRVHVAWRLQRRLGVMCSVNPEHRRQRLTSLINSTINENRVLFKTQSSDIGDAKPPSSDHRAKQNNGSGSPHEWLSLLLCRKRTRSRNVGSAAR